MSSESTQGQRSWRTAAFVTALCLAGWGTPPAVRGHATGESYVWLNVETSRLEGRFEIRLEDLRQRLGMSLPEEPAAALAAVRGSAGEVQAYLRERFQVRSGGAVIPIEFTTTEIVDTPELGSFAQYHYRTGAFEVPDRLEISNRVLIEEDRWHRSLLCIEYDRRRQKEYGEEFAALVFSRAVSEQALDLTDVRGLLRPRDFIWQGVLHIWIGIDHVLFLVALLLAAVLVRSGPGWEPVAGFRSAFWNLVKIVTAFTVAHSLTLTLAALDIVSLPGRVVESAIALSIVLVALNNVFPRFRDGNWLLIFFFGLFHGLGFASVMGELPFRMMSLVRVVLAFNIGVELGQLAIVVAVFPIIYALRRTTLYQPAVLVGGSLVISILAAYWFMQRALGLTL